MLYSFMRAYLGARWRFTRLHGEALARYQHQRAVAVAQHAIKNAPFYRDHFAGLDVRKWANFPTVDKRDMMRHFDGFNTRGISRDRAWDLASAAEKAGEVSGVIDGVTAGLSSGTSGERGMFLVDPAEQAAWAGFMLARALPMLVGRNNRIALFLRSNSRLYQRLQSPVIAFKYFDLQAPVELSVSLLNAYQPKFLAAPASVLGALAQEQSAGRLSIRPERIYSVAEVLEPQDVTPISSAFSCAVGQIYQSTEGLLAVSCSHGSLHVQEDIVSLQFEPPIAQGCPAGDPRLKLRCMPIITDLWRRTQPIIRYRLQDILRLGGSRCACGSSFRTIECIEGRFSDIVHLNRKQGGQMSLFPGEVREAVLVSAAIEDYRVIQEIPGQLVVHLATASAHDFMAAAKAVEQSLDALAQSLGCLPGHVVMREGIPPAAPGVKRQRVRRF